MSKRKWAWIIILVLAIALVVVMIMNGRSSNYASNTPIPTPTAASVKKSSSTSGTANQSQTYSQLIKDYEGKRIQFDINCQAVPTSATYKSGTKVMFDNRSGDARTITIDGIKYSFPGYGYRLLILSSSKLPHIVNLNCGSAVNVGSVLIQK